MGKNPPFRGDHASSKYQIGMCVREIGVLRKIASDKQVRASGWLAIRVDTIHSLVTIKNGGKIGNPRLRLLTFSPSDAHLVLQAAG